MSELTGPPLKLQKRRMELTPMLTQYVDLCAEYDDAVLLFRVGDFYKAFCDTAREVARICELTLIEREDSTGTYAACGIPVDNASRYLDRLLEAGHRLAIADQVEDPEQASGLVDRAVTRVITPGTIVSEDLIPADSNTYVACLTRIPAEEAEKSDTGGGSGAKDAIFGLAHVDVSTGECAVTTSAEAGTVRAELARIDPAELVLGPDVDFEYEDDCPTTSYESDAFQTDVARDRVAGYVDPSMFDSTAALVAAGGLLAYAEWTQGGNGPLDHITRIRRYDPRRALQLDATALEGLELFENPTGSRTLFGTVDQTVSALGRRQLRRWLRRPLIDPELIETRHDRVEAFVDHPLVRETVRDCLAGIYDLERLVSRVARERADARDLRSLHATLDVVPQLRTQLEGIEGLEPLRAGLDSLTELRELIDQSLQSDPPTEITDGGIIREGYDSELDELRGTAREGREWIADLERSERDRTGIDNLEVGYNEVHGYYIEVTNGQLDQVPDNYERRQTLKNSERFYTPDLKRREDEIISANERADRREYELFREIRGSVADATDRLQELAEALARLDALAALATVAVQHDYVRPQMDGDGIEIRAGRHPVVEREAEFVPNDADLGRGSLTVVTGPNMSGKSTYMRQVALVCVLAQTGSFVPADSARLPVLDRVFTRVGASDDIAGGESTFMREMSELTSVLHDATADSLVLLDEVGRGTSTTDGRAIARAAAEFVHDEVGAITLFATHYHSLSDLAASRTRIQNLHFTATREEGDVTFLHRVREGAASSSYGIEVAEMAGVPASVVSRARRLVDESNHRPQQNAGREHANRSPTLVDFADSNGHGKEKTTIDGSEKADGTDSSASVVVERLRGVRIAETTPLEALGILHDLQRQVERRSDK